MPFKQKEKSKKEEVYVRTIKSGALHLFYDIMDELGYPQIARGRGQNPDSKVKVGESVAETYKREKYSTTITIGPGGFGSKRTINVATSDPLLIDVLKNPGKLLYD